MAPRPARHQGANGQMRNLAVVSPDAPHLPDGSSPALVLRGVGHRFGDREVLTGVDLVVGPGEVVAVVGPSGCGKTTLCGIASGLIAPTSGTVERAAGRVGYVFQSPALMAWRTVADNVALLAEIDGGPGPHPDSTALARQVDDALHLVGLADVADLYPHQLSGGMQMRASVARSLVGAPELVLFDEPFGALDQITRGRLDVEFAALARKRQLSGLFVTHDVAEAVLVANRVVVMGTAPGRVVAEVVVPFGFPRTADLRFHPDFVACVAAATDALGVAA